MDVPFWVWAVTVAAIVGMLVFDLVGHVRGHHLEEVLTEGEEDVLLRGVVEIERALRDARLLDDLGHRGALVALLPEHLAGGGEELVLPLGPLAGGRRPRGSARPHDRQYD